MSFHAVGKLPNSSGVSCENSYTKLLTPTIGVMSLDER